MDLASRFEPQRAAPVPPLDNSTSSNSLFPPYYPPRSSSLAQSKGPNAGNRSASPASSITYTQISLNDADDNAKGPNPKPRSTWRRYPRLFFDILPQGWVLEYISCLISVLAFGSMIVVLREFDQRNLPSWPLGITLNTLIAFLTAICQSTFLYPVTQGLSQLKWNWFKGKNRPLGDFERFDNASRGAWGGVLLTFGTKGRLSVLLATILLVTSAATSTITQAVLTQSTRYVSTAENATIYRMINDNKTGYASTIQQATGNMISALYTSTESSYNFTDPVCTTGNCQWPLFSSLAVCVETNDITDKLVFQELADQCCTENYNATTKWEGWLWTETCTNCTQVGLTKDPYLTMTPQYDKTLNSTSYLLDHSDNEAWSYLYTFSNESFGYNSLAAAQILYVNSSDAVKYGTPPLNNTRLFMEYVRAVEALFFMCVETYNVTTTNGTTTTNVTSVASNVTYYDSYGYLEDNEPVIVDNSTITVDGFNYSFAGVNINLQELIQSMVYGYYVYGDDYDGLGAMTTFTYALGTVLYSDGNYENTTGTTRDDQMRGSVNDVLSNMARACTNWLRSYIGEPVEGQNLISESYVIVRWPYLIFLGVQILLSVVFLIWVILDSKVRKVDILKDSGIAALFALSAEDKENFEARFALLDEKSDEREDLERMSEVTLVKNEPGQWNLKAVD